MESPCKNFEQMLPVMEKTLFLLGAWEFNNRGLLYVPETGDWADEYIHNGYVLYDQLLYLQALRTMAVARKKRYSRYDHSLNDRLESFTALTTAGVIFTYSPLLECPKRMGIATV